MRHRQFSARLGLVKLDDVLQRGGMDSRLTTRLWTVCNETLFPRFNADLRFDEVASLFYYVLWDEFFAWPADRMGSYGSTCVEAIRTWFLSAEWSDKYDFLQFVASIAEDRPSDVTWGEIEERIGDFTRYINVVLEQERSAYRFTGRVLSEIIDENEIASVNAGLELRGPLSAARAHLATALQRYADRDNPNYRNSIKESISAVEASFFALNGQKSASLGEALKQAEKKGFVLHPALRTGVLSIYGWTSDENGVRHGSMIDAPNVGSDEAKLMLVLCSSLVSYIQAKGENLLMPA